MTATDQLDKISTLIDALTPLGSKQRGMRIEADEWNRLVTTMLGILAIDKAQETTTRLLLEGGFAVKDHQHLGQVETVWLDPVLQERISGGSGSLSVRTLLADVAKRVDTGATEIARLTDIAAEQQQRNDRASVEELERSAKLRGFEDRFGSIADLRGLVTGLDAKVNGLEPGIQAVLALRGELRDPSGAPVDVSALAREVAALRKLSQNFNGVDGRPVRTRDMEIRLKQIEDVLGLAGGGGLESRFAALADQLGERLDGRVDDRVGAARDQLRAELEALITIQVPEQVKAAVGAALEGLEPRIDNRISGRLDDLLGTVDERVKAVVDERLADVPQQVAEAVDRRLREFDLPGRFKDLGNRLREELRADNDTMRRQIAELDDRLRRLGG